MRKPLTHLAYSRGFCESRSRWWPGLSFFAIGRRGEIDRELAPSVAGTVAREWNQIHAGAG